MEYDLEFVQKRKEENLERIKIEKEKVRERFEALKKKKSRYGKILNNTKDPQLKEKRSKAFEEFIEKYYKPAEERVKRVTERELHEYVVSYSIHKNPEDAEFIINAFDNMIRIYVHLICCQSGFKIERARDRKFVCLYCPKFIYKSIDNYNRPKVKAILYDAVQYIRYMFRLYTEDEIKDECRIVLLDMASRYRDYERPSFHTLIDRLYHYKLYSQLKSLIKDPAVRKENYDFDEYIFALENNGNGIYYNALMENVSINDFESAEERIDFYYDTKNNPVKLKKPDIMDLDINWLLGTTARGIFKDLTVTERKILKLKYFNNLTDMDIAKQIGLTSNVVGAKKRELLRKLQERYEKGELYMKEEVLYTEEDIVDMLKIKITSKRSGKKEKKKDKGSETIVEQKEEN